MLCSLVLTLALTGQSPNPDAVASPERQRQLLAALQAKAGRPDPAPMRRPAARSSAGTASDRRAGYQAHNRQVQREVDARDRQQAALIAEQERQYRRDLPMMLQRQSEIERNQALHRMAAAAEQEAINQQWLIWQMRSR